MFFSIIWWSVLSAATAVLFSRFIGTRGLQVFLVANMFTVLCFSSLILFFMMCSGGGSVFFHEYVFSTWWDFGWSEIAWGLIYDLHTAIMVVTVCSVSACVHLYSCYYMATDPNLRRFLVYLSLFTFFMLFLVSANNLIMLFFGWEGVGVCSFLLVNFWYTRVAANKSALKAVIVNRVGDCGLIIAIGLLLNQFGTVDFENLFTGLIFFPIENTYLGISGFTSIDWICLFLFIGVMAKSAQVGLHTWLPDAMEGPTPVSALIHAATMVTAGIFLLIRTAPLFECSPKMLTVVAVVGGLTALFAASTALFQYDLKKVIAYSTCSQLGYMVMACGCTQFSLAFFHLVNHAFFKALLFLGAGITIHCLGGEQDMRRMGGLRNIFPEGLVFMGAASAALAGIPFLSGFYSKDAILGVLFIQSGTIGLTLWWVGIVAAIFTSMYSAASLYFIFFGKPRANIDQYVNGHGVDTIAWLPLLLLAVLSVTSGYIFRDLFIGAGAVLLDSTSSLFSTTSVSLDLIEWTPLWVKILITLVGASGFIWYSLIGYGYEFGAYFGSEWRTVYQFFFYRWYWDSIYNHFIAWPLFNFSYNTAFLIFDKGLNAIATVELGRVGSILAAKKIGSYSLGDLLTYLLITSVLSLSLALVLLIVILNEFVDFFKLV